MSVLKSKMVWSATIASVAGLAWLAMSIHERKLEAQSVRHTEPIPADKISNSTAWARSFPFEYSGYVAATEQGNSSRDLTDDLAMNPALVSLWAGYGFSKDYNKPRGHAFAVLDIINTLRTGGPTDDKSGPMPATCWSCKSPDVPRVMKRDGVKEFYAGKWARLGHEIANPIGCADCHDSQTGALQISRPALVEARSRMKKPIELASHQEMRSLVCAQCHVEYYFNKGDNYLNFPWDNGTNVEDMEKYYEEREFSDWTHALSKAPMLKAQHPDFELFEKGIHGKRGVACADCHMPYKSEGGSKVTDHHVQSPLANISGSCQQCHRQSEATLVQNVSDMKDQVHSVRKVVEEELVRAHWEAKKAWDLGAKPEQMNGVLKNIRIAQWRWDYAVASQGAYFHATSEVLRILSLSIKAAGDARSELRVVLGGLGWSKPVDLPDLSSKEKAQAAIGLDMSLLMEEKKVFKEKIVPKWREEAATLDRELLKRIEQ